MDFITVLANYPIKKTPCILCSLCIIWWIGWSQKVYHSRDNDYLSLAAIFRLDIPLDTMSIFDKGISHLQTISHSRNNHFLSYSASFSHFYWNVSIRKWKIDVPNAVKVRGYSSSFDLPFLRYWVSPLFCHFQPFFAKIGYFSLDNPPYGCRYWKMQYKCSHCG